ncbi:MAG: hypothetical protein HY831_03960 [Candidatus Aenigmarchaeota archaeon]|nr:hypothetical protein [Candidatus Aenigmarchaeota archaeon]
MKKIIFISAIAAVVIVIVIAVTSAMILLQKSSPEKIHLHSDFKVYLNGQAYNFTSEKYMSMEGHHLSERTHLHDMNGDIIHIHAAGVSLGEFFNSSDIKFNSTCFVLNNGTSYCNSDNSKIKLYVNGIENIQMEKYNLKDLDRILITYGNESSEQIKSQIDGVTDVSCIYSLKCPERGSPPDESSCVGGNGTMCVG